MPKIGAHVSAAVSLERAFIKAQEIGAECMQIFIAPPRQWAKTNHGEEEIERFLKAQKETGIGPNFIHGTYMVSVGRSTPEQLDRTIDWLIWSLEMANKLGITGVNFHPGSHSGDFALFKSQIVDSLKKVLAKSPASTLLLLENAASSKSIGGNFRELGEILKEVGDDRLKVCLDLQHAFGAGYDVKSPLGLKDVLEEFDQEIGLENLALIHANDSKVEYKSGRDRHENIGEGFIGRDGFTLLINEPKLKDVPFVLEVPGFGDNGPDKENVEILKSLRK